MLRNADHVSAWLQVGPDVDDLLLYNTTDKTLKKNGEANPAIKAEPMNARQFARYKAGDGLKIAAWLTVPKSAGKNLPMVVLVHGGPFLRGGAWAWDTDSQFLAARRWVMLKPEFRGSTGYGAALSRPLQAMGD